ncbi:MAG: UPF0280 family protein [Firmicutes bacterium]|nr:UPF0280 family protein [Bacillota bacterium]
MQYIERTYRQLHRQQDLKHFQVAEKETDLDIAILKECYNDQLIAQTKKLIKKFRQQLESYLKRDQKFKETLEPHKTLPHAPAIAREMAQAASEAGIGPMASVAGAFAQYVGKELLRYSDEVIVENGGDIFISTKVTRNIGVFAAQSPFSNRIALEILPEQTPIGICTSSGTVGHSLSFGKADAVVVLSASTLLADATATAAANMVENYEDLQQAVDFAIAIPGINGALVIKDDKMVAQGEIKLTPIM